MSVTWMKHKYSVPKPTYPVGHRKPASNGDGKLGKGKSKGNLTPKERANLPIQAERTLFIDMRTGSRKMMNLDEVA